MRLWQAPRPHPQARVVGVVGADVHGAGLGHGVVRLAQVVAGLGQQPGHDAGEHVQLDAVGGPLAALEQREHRILGLHHVHHDVGEGFADVVGGEAADLRTELGDGLGTCVTGFGIGRETQGTPGRHGHLPFEGALTVLGYGWRIDVDVEGLGGRMGDHRGPHTRNLLDLDRRTARRRRGKQLVHGVAPVRAGDATLRRARLCSHVAQHPATQRAEAQAGVFAVVPGALLEASDDLLLRALIAGDERRQQRRPIFTHPDHLS